MPKDNPTTTASEDFDSAVERIRGENHKLQQAVNKVAGAAGDSAPDKKLQAAIDELVALNNQLLGKTSGVPERRAPHKAE